MCTAKTAQGTEITASPLNGGVLAHEQDREGGSQDNEEDCNGM